MEMEFDSLPEFTHQNPESDPQERVKSSLRLQYDAQVRVIRSQIGELEKVRADLGLSQRKIAQLLMVDPSAWTRWNRPGEEAPPHVWRALQWYLALKEKIPGLTPAYFLHADPRVLHEKALRKVDDEREAREQHIAGLHAELQKKLRELEGSTPRIEEWTRAQNRLQELEGETKRLRKWSFFWIAMTFALLVLMITFIARPARADETSDIVAKEALKPAGEAARDKVDDPQSVEPPKTRFLIPIAYYTPETGVAAGALAIQNFGTLREGRTSSLTGILSLTARGQYIVSLAPRHYRDDGGGDLSGVLAYKYFPSEYYGRGVSGTLGTEHAETYTDRSFVAAFSPSFHLGDAWAARLGVGYDRRRLSDEEPGGRMASEIATFGNDLETTQVSAGLEWDDRDYPQAAREGSFHRLQVSSLRPEDKQNGHLLPALVRTELDLRGYRRVRDDATVASQLFAGEIAGDPSIPFPSLYGIGGGEKLRGFAAGRFRDRALLMVQAEWRQELRHRWTASGGIGWGRLASTAAEWSSAQDLWSGSVGVNYILDLRNRTKMRLDVGFAQKPGVYLLMGEAF